MKRMGIDDQIKAAIQDLVAPARQRRRPPRRQDRLDSLAAQMGHMRGEHVAEIRRVDARIDGVDRELRRAIDIRERLAALEARRS